MKATNYGMPASLFDVSTKDILINVGKYGTLIILFLMVVFFSIFLEPFRSLENLLNILGQGAIVCVLSIGLTCTMKVGDYDLSIGAVAAMSGLIVAWLLVNDFGILPSIIITLLCGVFVGLVNGLLVAYVGLVSIICTLATMSIILGAGMSITKGNSIWSGIPDSFAIIGRGDLWGIPVRFVIVLIILAIIWVIHTFTETGRRMEAIGGNPTAAHLSGISVDFYRMIAFMLSGFCSAWTGIILTSYLMTANPTQGSHYLLDAFAACFIGAATVKIGQFHVWGTFIGVLITVIGVNGLMIIGVPGYLTDMIKGMILLLAIILSAVVTKFVGK